MKVKLHIEARAEISIYARLAIYYRGDWAEDSERLTLTPIVEVKASLEVPDELVRRYGLKGAYTPRTLKEAAPELWDYIIRAFNRIKMDIERELEVEVEAYDEVAGERLPLEYITRVELVRVEIP